MTTATLQVRSDADFARLHELLVEYERYLPPALRHGPVPGQSELPATYAAPAAAFLALSDAEAIGCVAVTPLDAATAVLLRLYVRQEHRGAGAGRSLVTSALTFLRESGYERVVLETDKGQLEPAYRLYLSLGFAECTPYAAGHTDCATFMELRFL